MPRLYHCKSQYGCLRCKQRKVKCDEGRPKCAACIRHRVQCEYSSVPASNVRLAQSGLSIASQHTASTRLEANGQTAPTSSNYWLPPSQDEWQLKLRLLHVYAAFTSLTMSPAVEIWQTHMPRLGFQYTFVFDAMMALSAMHLNRDTALRNSCFPDMPSSMLHQISRRFFDKALTGYQECLASLAHTKESAPPSLDTFEAAYVAASLVSICTLCQLGEADESRLSEGTDDEALWFRLVMGIRQIVGQWKQCHGRDSWETSPVYSSKPDLSSTNMEELFNPQNGVLLEPLLQWASHYIVLDTEEREAYEHTLSYLGLIYGQIQAGVEAPQAICHRLRALPARAPRRFGVAVTSQQPLALTIVAYIFAMMKLLEDDVLWFCGIAEKHVRRIERKLPAGWRPLLKWPIAIVDGSISRGTPPSLDDESLSTR